MTFKDIQKKLVQKQEYSQSPDSKYTRLLFDRLKGVSRSGYGILVDIDRRTQNQW